MAKKNYTWKLDEDLVSKIQKLAEKEHRSLTNYTNTHLTTMLNHKETNSYTHLSTSNN